MFQTFTGSSRRPRQVNLSGRTTNPFAKYGAPQGKTNTVELAQQIRAERQQERVRIQAATNVQRTWRGFSARKQLQQSQRQEWEHQERIGSDLSDSDSYDSAAEAYGQLTRLLRFINVQDDGDQDRLARSYQRLFRSVQDGRDTYSGGPWPSAYLRLQNTCLNGLQRVKHTRTAAMFLEILSFTTDAIPALTTTNAHNYYLAMRKTLQLIPVSSSILAAPLQTLLPATERAYQAFATQILTVRSFAAPLQQCDLGGSLLEQLSESLNCKLLTRSLQDLIQQSGGVIAALYPSTSKKASTRTLNDAALACAWLAAYLIYFHRQIFRGDQIQMYTSEPNLIFVLCVLLSVVADSRTTGTLATVGDAQSWAILDDKADDSFVTRNLDTLVNQDSISGLLSQMKVNGIGDVGNQSNVPMQNDQSKVLATYILTLLRLFPHRADDIRMWLYVGSSSSFGGASTANGQSAISFFWKASRNTAIFRKILHDPGAAVDLLKSKTSVMFTPSAQQGSANSTARSIEDEWQIVLLFMEMYSFVLKVMDDEEFFTYNDTTLGRDSAYGRKNSLRRDEIMTLSTFLKHLGFTMYYNAADITGSRESEASKDIRNLFRVSGQTGQESDRLGHHSASASATGVNLDYMKYVVTGLLRAIYERDSRRPFTPKDHWLMTARFDMTSFIDAVVEEEERRHQIQEAEREEEHESSGEESGVIPSPSLVGTGRVQRLQKLENLKRQQRKESRRRYLQAVAPRLEILQNMPFLIPFTTRVQIFRRFVQLDQLKRRNGMTDPEDWRLSQVHGFGDFHRLERHHAKVRRGHEFEDAFDQFYDLGASLKEPIHITFLDQFDQEEAGIDGGGVTKEFLTSVTNGAFGDQGGIRLFVENEKHLLFPNPSAVDEQQEILFQSGVAEKSQVFRSQMTDLLQRYEFLGRIIGKCLYEGILVDIGFAGFFLLKWALTGGSGAAPKESGYRANINDLREFDEELYQGLLKLKNYPGNVEDFSLNFTVTDTISIPSKGGVRKKAITRELRPKGNDTPVTNSNRLLYISCVAIHRLSSQPYRQTGAFLRGLGSMISPSWLSMFNQQELQTLVGGAASAINIGDLRAHTSYGGVYVIGDDGLEHPSVQVFWKVMESLADEDRRKVLKFVTSTPRAPLLGFGSLMPRFSIRDSGVDDARLPSTSTCVNLLKLPRYTSFDTCRTKLLQAVNSGAGFDLS